jgi:CBS-domain-containing membrane protein
MRRFVQFKQPKASWLELVVLLIGGVLTIGVLALITEIANLPLLWAPFGGTCVLLFAAHSSPFSQPMNVVGGHLLSASVSYLLLAFLPHQTWALALTVGIVIAAMRLARVTHPPAGANPIVIYLTKDAWMLVLPTLALGAVAIVAVAFLVHRLTRTQYPV